MDINQLHYFLITSEEMNYAKAAERIYISRQALVKAIKKLEMEVGYQLFLTDRNKLYLTSFGQHLWKKAMPVVKAFHDMERDLGSSYEGKADTIRIAIGYSILPFLAPWLPKVFSEFNKDNPEIHLDISEHPEESLEESVLTGNAHMAILPSMPRLFKKVDSIILQSEPLYLHVHRENPLYYEESVSFNQLRQYTCMVPSDPKLVLHQLVEECAKENAPFDNFTIVRDGGGALSRLRNNDGVSLGVRTDFDPLPPSTKLIPFQHSNLLWNIYLILSPEIMKNSSEYLLAEYLKQHIMK